MSEWTVSLFGVDFDEMNVRGAPECFAAGREPGAGDSGYQGTNPHGRKGIFVWPRCSLDALPSHPVQSHSLCMRRTFKIMSFLSKARKGRHGQVRFSVASEREWKRNIFTTLKSAKTKTIVDGRAL